MVRGEWSMVNGEWPRERETANVKREMTREFPRFAHKLAPPPIYCPRLR
jgi:hypothetical protein